MLGKKVVVGKQLTTSDGTTSAETTFAAEKTPSATFSAEPAALDSPNLKSGFPVGFREDKHAARKLLLKIDLRLIPILGCLYLVSFLDRSNIANARIEGLEKSLNMPSNGFNTCLWIFYLPFALIEIPSNIIMSWPKIKPNAWLGGMMFVLGVVSMCQGFTTTYGGLLACRFIMGIVEAALPPGAALLIGQYYKRNEFAIRFAWFICFALAGNCFSGLLAFAIRNLNGTRGLEGWRWIFIIEGLMTIVFSICAYFIIPAFPHESTFLSGDEKSRLLARLEADRGEEKQDLRGVPWIKVLLDWKVWTFTVVFFCCDMGASSIASFTPTILNQLGWTAAQAQVMSMPIWITGIVLTLSCSYLSGRLNIRYPFVLLGISLSLIGWAIQRAQVQPAGVRYFALFTIASGSFVQMPILIGWLNGNLRGRVSQAVGAAIQLGIGNCANFVASNVFITSEAPKYPTGFSTGLAVTCVGGAVALFLIAMLMWHNKKLDAKLAQSESGPVADDQMHFRYML